MGNDRPILPGPAFRFIGMCNHLATFTVWVNMYISIMTLSKKFLMEHLTPTRGTISQNLNLEYHSISLPWTSRCTVIQFGVKASDTATATCLLSLLPLSSPLSILVWKTLEILCRRSVSLWFLAMVLSLILLRTTAVSASLGLSGDTPVKLRRLLSRPSAFPGTSTPW